MKISVTFYFKNKKIEIILLSIDVYSVVAPRGKDGESCSGGMPWDPFTAGSASSV